MDLESLLQGQCFANNEKEIFALERKALIALLGPPCDAVADIWFCALGAQALRTFWDEAAVAKSHM